MNQPFWLSALGKIPRKGLSRLVGRLVHAERPRFLAEFIKRRLIASFNIVVDEAEFPLSHYPSFGAFFARRLKSGARSFEAEGCLSPCDGSLEQWGKICDGTLVQCKGKTYPLETLLGDRELAKAYEGGMFMTIYLAPYNYHRVHWGLGGELAFTRWLDGDLWPVNATSVEYVENLFCINERCLSELRGPWGRMTSVMVGATNVGWMEMAHLEPEVQEIMKKRGGGYATHEGLALEKGDEFGVFNMGSTVILVLDAQATESFDWSELKTGTVRAGEVLGAAT